MLQNKLAVHFADGTILKGQATDFRHNKPEFHLTALDGETSVIAIADLKAVFFVRDYEGTRERQRSYEDVIAGGGRKLKVSFSDGEEIIGYTSGYSADRIGFFLIPADLEDNNERIFVVAAACDQVEFL